MRFEFSTSAYFKDGQLIVRNRSQLQAQALASGLTEFDVVVTSKKKKRSTKINRYYWGVVVAQIRDAFRELGNDVDSELTHEFLKGRFHYKEFIDTKSGEVMKLPQSTADITNTEFMEYMERIKQFGSEVLNIYIAEPNEQLEILPHLK